MLLAASAGLHSNGSSITQSTRDFSHELSDKQQSTAANQATEDVEYNREIVTRHTDHDDLQTAMEGLGRYVIIRPHDGAESNKTLVEIAAHWQLGANPAKYDFEGMTARVTGRTLIGGSRSLSAAESGMRQQRLERRQALEAIRAARRAARQSALASSQPAGLPGRDVMSSQPRAVDIRTFGQSSQINSSQSQSAAVASQVVAGRFGGRPSAAIGLNKKAFKRKGF